MVHSWIPDPNVPQDIALVTALVGTLRAAKRKKIVTFEGELLLQGVHDKVPITLLKPDYPEESWLQKTFYHKGVEALGLVDWNCRVI